MKPTLIRVGEAPGAMRAAAVFLDGQRAAARTAEIRIEETAGGPELAISAAGLHPRRWPLAALRRLPDGAAADELILRQGDEPLARLVVRDAEARRIIAARAPALDARASLRGLPRIAAWATAALASVALIILVLVPVMANQLAAYLPAEGERALGDATFEQIRAALGDEGGPLGLCDAPAGVAALDRMTRRISADAGLPYPVRVHVLDHDLPNAFALPGGHVVFFRGLLDLAESPDQLAAVFAHELGHVARRDPTRIALRTAGSIGVLGLIFGDFAGGAAVLFLTERLIQASYTREAEAGADAFAHAALIAAGIRPSALAGMFERLQAMAGEANPIVAHFASHPDLGDRIAAARAADAALTGPPRPALDAADWAALGAICR